MRVEPPTSTMSEILFAGILESASTCSTGLIVIAKRSLHNSSNRARVTSVKKSCGPLKDSYGHHC